MTGNPKWTLDIGAFFVDRKEQWFWSGDYPSGADDPGYRELYARWMQFGAFLPMLRSHGTDTPREAWRFGEPGEIYFDTILSFIHLRYRLLPYIYTLAAREQSDDTMMRMLAFDFRSDPKVYDITDQYLFGPSIMVCPVTEPGAKTREVYLPAGVDWFDFWTGKRFAGGQTIVAHAALPKMPLFVRAGSILPLGPIVQSSGESLDAPLEIRIYPGRDGFFSLYEDEGDNYNFERSAFTSLPMKWHDSERRFTVGPRTGAFDGMPQRRELRVTIVGEGRGVGIAPEPKPDRVIDCEKTFECETRC